ncbi:MAG: nuclear transport factor 2 family protein [Burkholderiaceae bacterium]
MSPQALLKRFYAAFAILDARTMRSCYASDARFEDPVFALQGNEAIGTMWQMLCETMRNRGQAVFRLEARDIEAIEDRGSAHWEVRYRFGAAGRMVHNVVEAQFTFENGLIASHVDSFDFWRWARQALGPTGLALGWTDYLHEKVRRDSNAKLERRLQRDAARIAG